MSNRIQRQLLFVASCCLVALGQPALSPFSGLIAALCGYALFWKGILDFPDWQTRFFLGTVWFIIVQLVQFSWGLTHPFYYVYLAWVSVALLYALPFGCLSALITTERLQKARFVLFAASAWTLIEWSRLFILSGISWNPIGLALTGSLYPMQLASVGGVYLLSFWVILSNLYALRAWIFWPNRLPLAIFVLIALFPYLFGFTHIIYRDSVFRMASEPAPSVTSLLLQPNFPIEEIMAFKSPAEAVTYALEEWRQLLTALAPYRGEEIDLIAMPENVVPFGTYWPVYAYEQVKSMWVSIWGEQGLLAFPSLEQGWGYLADTPQGKFWYVSNGFIAQATATILGADLIAGLEDFEQGPAGETRAYAAAIRFSPTGEGRERYSKRILVPLAEYLPLEFLRYLTKSYGVAGEFTPGTDPVIVRCGRASAGISVCYEETMGHLMRDNKHSGADLLVNLTNDGWYPDSRLPQVHFDHSRLRTVELGLPLVRASNTGFTGAVDSLGRMLGVLESSARVSVLKVQVPLTTYHTFYVLWGNAFIVTLCGVFLLLSWKR